MSAVFQRPVQPPSLVVRALAALPDPVPGRWMPEVIQLLLPDVASASAWLPDAVLAAAVRRRIVSMGAPELSRLQQLIGLLTRANAVEPHGDTIVTFTSPVPSGEVVRFTVQRKGMCAAQRSDLAPLGAHGLDAATVATVVSGDAPPPACRLRALPHALRHPEHLELGIQDAAGRHWILPAASRAADAGGEFWRLIEHLAPDLEAWFAAPPEGPGDPRPAWLASLVPQLTPQQLTVLFRFGAAPPAQVGELGRGGPGQPPLEAPSGVVWCRLVVEGTARDGWLAPNGAFVVDRPHGVAHYRLEADGVIAPVPPSA